MPIITYGDTAIGLLTGASDASTTRPGSFSDKYTFTAVEFDLITIHEVSTDFDSYCYLLGTDGTTVLAQNDDSDGSNSFITFFIPASGVYTIEATTYAAAATGAYTLTLTGAPSGGVVLEDHLTDTDGHTFSSHAADTHLSGSGYFLMDGLETTFTSNAAKSPNGTSVCLDFESAYDLHVGSSFAGGVPLNREYNVYFTITVPAAGATRHEFGVIYAFGTTFGRLLYRVDTATWTVDTASAVTGPWTTVASGGGALSPGTYACKVQVRMTGIELFVGSSSVLTALAATGLYLPFGLTPGTDSNDVALWWYDEASAVTTYTYTDDFSGTGYLDDHLTAEGTGWHDSLRADNYILNGSGQVEQNPATSSGSTSGYQLNDSPGWCADQTDVSATFVLPAPINGRLQYSGQAFTLSAGAPGVSGGFVANVNHGGLHPGWWAFININNVSVFTSGMLIASDSPGPTSMRVDLRGNRVKFYVDGASLYDQPYTVAGDPGNPQGLITPVGFFLGLNTQVVDVFAGYAPDWTLIQAESYAATTGSRTSISGVSLSYLKVEALGTSTPFLPCEGGQRPLSTLFADTLAGECLNLACCLKLTRSDGFIYGFTSLDANLTIDGVTYEAQDGLGLSNLRTKTGTGIDNFDLTGLQTANRIVADDLRGGRYDGARISLFAVDYEQLDAGVITLLTGNIGQVTHSDGGFQFEARSLTQRLAQQVGDLYCPLCRVHQLGDAQCKVDLSLYTFTRTVAGTPDRGNIFFGADTHASGYYDYGLVTFITGLNSGIARPVKMHSLTGGGAALVMGEPFPFNVAAGDTASLQAGCDRTTAICKSRFSNILNYRGEPMIPRSDALIQIQRTA